MSRIAAIAALVVFAAVLAACNATEPGSVAKQWSQEMRELQINPVFPPREDFQVGDVYLPAVRPEDVRKTRADDTPLPISLWLTSLDIDDAMERFYDRRSTYPATQADNIPGDGDAAAKGLEAPIAQAVLNCDDTSTPEHCNIFTEPEDTALRRLRVVGFPTFLSTTIRNADLSAFIPAEAFTAALGASFGDVRSVSVSVPVAESIALPAGQLLSNLQTKLKSLNLCGPDGSLGAFLPRGQRPEDDAGRLPESFHLVVVSEVFYTRAVDVNVHTEEKFGFGGKAKPVFAAEAPPTNPSTSAQAPGGAKEDGKSSQSALQAGKTEPRNPSLDRAKGLLDAANKTIGAYQARTAPGASFKFLSVSDGSVGMRRTFIRPIAIGYRGLELKVRSDSCAVIGGGPENTDMPRGERKEAAQG